MRSIKTLAFAALALSLASVAFAGGCPGNRCDRLTAPASAAPAPTPPPAPAPPSPSPRPGFHPLRAVGGFVVHRVLGR
jgi:hypothetical protein